LIYQFAGVAYSSLENLWLAPMRHVSDTLAIIGALAAYSYDGFVWYYGNETAYGMLDLNFASWNSGFFLTGGINVNTTVGLWKSFNAIVFTDISANLGALGFTTLTDAAFSNNEGRWVVIGGSRIAYSTTGNLDNNTIWTLSTTSGTPPTVLYGLCYSLQQSIWMLVGEDYIATSSVSAGSFIPFPSSNTSGNTFWQCAYGNGYYMIPGYAGAQYFVARATNSSIIDKPVSATYFVQGVAYSDNWRIWSAVGPGTAGLTPGLYSYLSTNLNGTTWNAVFNSGLGIRTAFAESA
jgi:hypothetical protein